jgi:hypothetical protein
VKTLYTLALALPLAGCGSFPLGTSDPQQSQTRAQIDSDILFCKDKAKTEANTDARQVGSFIAGMTIIGIPLAVESERAKQREIYAACMGERGYRVVPPS